MYSICQASDFFRKTGKITEPVFRYGQIDFKWGKMGEIHNLQIVIAQSSLLNTLNEGHKNAAVANGAQILNVVEKDKSIKKLSKVSQLDELEKTEKEDAKKRRLKRAAADRLIDIYQ